MKKATWFLFALLASLVGLYPLIYFVIDRRFGLLGTKSNALLADLYWNTAFYTHIIFGGIALLIGWIQFSAVFRSKYPALHKRIGKMYIICVLLSSVSGLYIALFATGGWVTMIGFILLDVIWFYSSITAFLAIKKLDIEKHQNLMTYSYSATFAAVTLRIWLPVATLLSGSFFTGYPIAAWLAFIPNMIVAFFMVQRRKAKISMP